MGAGRVGGHAEFGRWKATGGPRAWMDAQVPSPRGGGSRLGLGEVSEGIRKNHDGQRAFSLGKRKRLVHGIMLK